MDKVANYPPDDRRDLFQETANRRGLTPIIIEKDFWVCWVLKHMFSDESLKNHLVFKGGTSLSKVYGLIHRFSEDVDLILDWALLGYDNRKIDPHVDRATKSQQDKLNKQLNNEATIYIAETLIDQLRIAFSACPEIETCIAEDDSLTVNVAYPVSYENTYIQPVVRLEIGPLAAKMPSSAHTIQPYAAEAFPDAFEDASCPVIAIAAERTFWEKATILHQEAHRLGKVPPRHSRHYYDLHQLIESDVCERALTDHALRIHVVAFKQKFYPSAWANYGEANPGTFRLLPTEENAIALRADYEQMTDMIFGDAPSFDAIVSSITGLERRINGL